MKMSRRKKADELTCAKVSVIDEKIRMKEIKTKITTIRTKSWTHTEVIPATNGSEMSPAMNVQVTNAAELRIDESDTNGDPSDDDTADEEDDGIKENEESFFDTASVGTNPTAYW